MKLFSKRNKRNFETLQSYRDRPYSSQGSRFSQPVSVLRRKKEIISSEARNRIVSQIKFLASGKVFLEPYVLIEDKKEKNFSLNSILLDNFSLSELGYQFSTFFKFRAFEFLGEKISNSEEETIESIFDDYRLFDLIETVILFSKESHREEVITRINRIFLEEGCNWKIIKHLITRNAGENLSDLTNQLKDEKLRNKLKAYYEFQGNDDYRNSAKISADILNIIFSDFLQSNKKKQIEIIKNDVVSIVVENIEEKSEKKDEMKKYLEELLISSKNLSNNIFDVRHSEKSTIKITNPYIYKLISRNNMSLVEFVLTSLKDDFIITENWESIKAEYLEKYNIDKSITYFYPEKEEIDPDEIPF